VSTPRELGVSFAEVRAALGKPDRVARRRHVGFGREYVEYVWGATPD
jgi:hypothetical protein